MKRAIFTFLILLIIIFSPVHAQAEELIGSTPISSGKTGDVDFELYDTTGDGNGNYLKVFGDGEMGTYYNYELMPWFDSRKLISSVEICEGVTSIGAGNFVGCLNLKDISIPNTVTVIDSYAFDSCEKLKHIKLPDSLKQIYESAFTHTGLVEITVPDSVTKIGFSAFSGCKELESAKLGTGLTEISSGLFNGCAKLTDINIPNSVKRIRNGAFTGCGIKTIELPASVTRLDENIFSGCRSLENVTFPSTLTYLDDFAFRDCTSLKSITLPASLTFIGKSIFDGCTEIEQVENKSTYRTELPNLGENSKWYCDSDLTEEVNELVNGVAIRKVYYLIGFYSESGDLRYDNITVTKGEPFGKLPKPELEKMIFDGWYHQNDDGTETKITENMIVNLQSNSTLYAHWIKNESVFDDVNDSKLYYYVPVLWAYNNKITTGVSRTRFAPEKACTRGQVVTFLWRAYGEPEPKTQTNPFSDVKEKDFFYKAVMWACENGITTGVNATSFAPNKTVTREQFVTFLWRSKGEPAPTLGNPFADVLDNQYYTDAVMWAYENGVTTGTSKTKFSPKAACTRGQVVTFIYRALK